MDDRELEALVRLACEADRLESEPAAAQPAGRGTVRLAPWIAGVGASLAAGVAIAAAVWATWGVPGRLVPAGPSTPGGRPVAAAQPVRESAVEPAGTEAPESWVVMTIFRGWDGECRCLHLERPELPKARPMETIRPAELLAMGLETPCSLPVERVIVLGIAGPAEDLPKTTADAEVVADCLAGAHTSDSALLATRAESCLSPGVTVMAEALEVDRPILR